MRPWSDSYFDHSCRGHAAQHRDPTITTTRPVGRWYAQYNLLPMTPVESLVQPLGDYWPLAQRTVEAAGAALHHMTVFNQLAQQQTLFYTLHAVEYVPEQLKWDLTMAAKNLSDAIEEAILDSGWHTDLMAALDANIAELENLTGPSAVNDGDNG